jgi:hypothetical protein
VKAWRSPADHRCRWLVALLLLACGCRTVTATGAPGRNHPAHEEMCRPLNIDTHRFSGPDEALRCAADADCTVCHDGSACGIPLRVDEAQRRGEACRKPDAGECECATVACCDGRCVVSGYCPR